MRSVHLRDGKCHIPRIGIVCVRRIGSKKIEECTKTNILFRKVNTSKMENFSTVFEIHVKFVYLTFLERYYSKNS